MTSHQSSDWPQWSQKLRPLNVLHEEVHSLPIFETQLGLLLEGSPLLKRK